MKTMDNRTIVRYLSGGALLEILGKHQGARNVWLRQNEEGNLVYTFIKPESGIGGQAVPRALLEGQSIFAPNQPKVIAFLQGFGLTLAEAAYVISAIGSKP